MESDINTSEFAFIIDKQPSSLYVRFQDDDVFLSLRDNKYQVVNYTFSYDIFDHLCDAFIDLKKSVLEKQMSIRI